MIHNPLIKKDSTFTVLGLGISGMAAARYAHACGAKLRISDAGSAQSIQDKIASLGFGDIPFEAGAHTFEFLKDSDLVFVSPGATCDTLLKRLEEDGVTLVGELSLAAAVELPPVVAITGTNGKTTVTSLIGELLKAGGNKTYVGGNIGYPLLDYLCSGEQADFLVLELSSFQLEYTGDFAPHIGLLLNLTPDHLDRHGDMQGYRRAKMHIFAGQKASDYALYPVEYPMCTPDVEFLGQRVPFGLDTHPINVEVEGFSLDIDGEVEHYDLRGSVFNTITGRLNAAPAAFAARKLGVSKDVVDAVLASFDLGEHRVEFCGEIEGVSYYNDSKATNTGAVISGLSQFESVVLIAGGRDKGDDYKLLRDAVAKKVSQLILIGEATPLIEEALSDIVPIYRASSLVDAMDRAKEYAQPGQAVLFAPACSSFDMFKNYKDRGEQFKQGVLRLQGAL